MSLTTPRTCIRRLTLLNVASASATRRRSIPSASADAMVARQFLTLNIPARGDSKAPDSLQLDPPGDDLAHYGRIPSRNQATVRRDQIDQQSENFPDRVQVRINN